MTTIYRNNHRRQRQASCPEMYVTQLAQLQGQFANTAVRDSLSGGLLSGPTNMTEGKEQILAPMQDDNVGADHPNTVQTTSSSSGQTIHLLQASAATVAMETGQDPRAKQRTRAHSQGSVDDHFARSLAKFADPTPPESPKPVRSAPYPAIRVRRTPSLPQMYNSQIAALGNVLANQKAANDDTLYSQPMNVGPGSFASQSMDTLSLATDEPEKLMRERKLPASFFSPKTHSPQTTARAPTELKNLLCGPSNSLSQSLHMIRIPDPLTELEEAAAPVAPQTNTLNPQLPHIRPQQSRPKGPPPPTFGLPVPTLDPFSLGPLPTLSAPTPQGFVLGPAPLPDITAPQPFNGFAPQPLSTDPSDLNFHNLKINMTPTLGPLKPGPPSRPQITMHPPVTGFPMQRKIQRPMAKGIPGRIPNQMMAPLNPFGPGPLDTMNLQLAAPLLPQPPQTPPAPNMSLNLNLAPQQTPLAMPNLIGGGPMGGLNNLNFDLSTLDLDGFLSAPVDAMGVYFTTELLQGLDTLQPPSGAA